MRWPLGLPRTSAVLACALCTGAEAAQWSVEPQLTWLMGYNSNIQLAPSNVQETGEAILSLDAVLKGRTETSEWDLHPHVDFQRYPRNDGFNANSGSLQGQYARHGERWGFTMNAGYEDASTLTTELTDTGIVDGSTRRNSANVGLAWQYDLSERQELQLQGSYANVVYPNGEQFGLVGYRYPSVSAGDTLVYSLQTSFGFTLYANDLHAPITGYDSSDRGARVKLTHIFSDLISVSATVGFGETVVLGNTQHGSIWDLRATRTTQHGHWDLDYSQSVQPSGRGYLIRKDSATLSLSQQLRGQLWATAAILDVRNSNLSSGPFLDVPRYSSIDAGLEWHVSEVVVLGVTSGYASTLTSVTYQSANGWHASLNAVWTPVPRSVSR
jgi:hypothetical protein